VGQAIGNREEGGRRGVLQQSKCKRGRGGERVRGGGPTTRSPGLHQCANKTTSCRRPSPDHANGEKYREMKGGGYVAGTVRKHSGYVLVYTISLASPIE